MNKRLILIFAAGVLSQLTACSSALVQDPQIYGMPKSQFARLSPAEQQQAIAFHSQYTSSQAMTGQQVAQLSSNNVQQVVISNNQDGNGQNTTVTTSAPSRGNPDLDASNNPDLAGAVNNTNPAPVIVNTNSGTGSTQTATAMK